MMANRKVPTLEILDSDGCLMPRPDAPVVPKAKKMPSKKKPAKNTSIAGPKQKSEKKFWYINGTISYEGNHGSMIFFTRKKMFEKLKELWAKNSIVQYTGYGPFPLSELEGFDTQGIINVGNRTIRRTDDESKVCRPKLR